MSRVGRYANAAMNLDWAPDTLPGEASIEPVTLPTPDRAATTGVLYRPASRARAVVSLIHPRVDMTSHYLIPPLVRAGFAVWAQRSRSVNNDLTAVHEQLLIDIAVASQWLSERALEPIYLLGNSGGASLYCFYIQQASREPKRRVTEAPSGLRVDLSLPMPKPAGLILLAPHKGQGDLLMDCIDPSVTNEDDPVSVDPALDPFDTRNGFREPPQSAEYSPAFLEAYRAGQRERVERIDAYARRIVGERRAMRQQAKGGNDIKARRHAIAPAFITVYRTDADPRSVDLSLDPSERDYGSVFGRRPDVTNYGPVGFGRLTTPDAWLSTWSGLSSRAAIRHTGPEIDVAALVISYAADNSVYPSDVATIHESLGSADKVLTKVRGDHYGYAPGTEDRSGGRRAAELVAEWLSGRT
jgi:hypothetical protein